MARSQQWRFNPNETRDIGVSMSDELDTGVTMTGESPTISAWTRTGRRGSYTYTAASGFTFSGEQINGTAITASDGTSVGIGKGVLFRCAAPSSQGTYYIRTECDASDGTHVVREDVLIVQGAGSPS